MVRSNFPFHLDFFSKGYISYVQFADEIAVGMSPKWRPLLPPQNSMYFAQSECNISKQAND
jgi:hypothetical protein